MDHLVVCDGTVGCLGTIQWFMLLSFPPLWNSLELLSSADSQLSSFQWTASVYTSSVFPHLVLSICIVPGDRDKAICLWLIIWGLSRGGFTTTWALDLQRCFPTSVSHLLSSYFPCHFSELSPTVADQILKKRRGTARRRQPHYELGTQSMGKPLCENPLKPPLWKTP